MSQSPGFAAALYGALKRLQPVTIASLALELGTTPEDVRMGLADLGSDGMRIQADPSGRYSILTKSFHYGTPPAAADQGTAQTASRPPATDGFNVSDQTRASAGTDNAPPATAAADQGTAPSAEAPTLNNGAPGVPAAAEKCTPESANAQAPAGADNALPPSAEKFSTEDGTGSTVPTGTDKASSAAAALNNSADTAAAGTMNTTAAGGISAATSAADAHDEPEHGGMYSERPFDFPSSQELGLQPPMDDKTDAPANFERTAADPASGTASTSDGAHSISQTGNTPGTGNASSADNATPGADSTTTPALAADGKNTFAASTATGRVPGNAGDESSPAAAGSTSAADSSGTAGNASSSVPGGPGTADNAAPGTGNASSGADSTTTPAAGGNGGLPPGNNPPATSGDNNVPATPGKPPATPDLAALQKKAEDAKEKTATKPMTLMEHLNELRWRLMRCIIAVGLAFIACWSFAEILYVAIMQPLNAALPPDSKLIYTAPAEAFFTYMRVAFVTALFAASPVIFYQIWAFISPGLYDEEKRYALPVAFCSALFFIGGGMFCYYIVLPFAFQFFMSFATDAILPMPSLNESLSFVLKLFIAFGVIFEMPLFSFFLSRMGLISAATMRKTRRYAILIIFIVAAVLTPPDVFSQLLMAGPMLILYEISILIAATFGREPRPSKEPDENPAGHPTA